jgi:hypothetical protein
MRELRTGSNISPLWRQAQVELSELLTQVIPGAEMAFLMKTGSDATSGAVRLARIYTGRTKVVRWGYNGWHDWSCARPNGIPESIRADAFTFQYNVIESVQTLFRKHPDKIACIMMMPFEIEAPYPTFNTEPYSSLMKCVLASAWLWAEHKNTLTSRPIWPPTVKQWPMGMQSPRSSGVLMSSVALGLRTWRRRTMEIRQRWQLRRRQLRS